MFRVLIDSSLSQREKMTPWPCQLVDNCLGWKAMWVMEGVHIKEMLSFFPHFLWWSQEWKVCVKDAATAQEDTGCAPQPPLRQNGKEFKNLFLCLAFQEASSCELALAGESLCHLYFQLAGHMCLWSLCHSLGVCGHTLYTFIMILYLINTCVSLITVTQKMGDVRPTVILLLQSA